LILDTTYLLPLAKIGIDTDVLLGIAEKKTRLRMNEIGISLISIFELQAKAAKLRVPAATVNGSIRAILENFQIVPFLEAKVVEISFSLRELIADYIDCVIVATAIGRRDTLATEDSRIWRVRDELHRMHGLNVHRYRDLAQTPD
jgi:predicted nucleic acid-binding protein